MVNAPTRYQLSGSTAAEICASAERELRSGRLKGGDRLPPVRTLASYLGVSPGTVAAAYRTLRLRGMTVGEGRRGTRVAHRPALTVSLASAEPAVVPSGARDLASGNPDPSLLPDLRPYLRELSRAGADDVGRLYGQSAHLPRSTPWTATSTTSSSSRPPGILAKIPPLPCSASTGGPTPWATGATSSPSPAATQSHSPRFAGPALTESRVVFCRTLARS